MSAQVLGREALVRNLSSFREDLVERLVTAVEITQSAVVDAARREHGAGAHSLGRFETQTGNLEESIQPGGVKVDDRFVSGEVQARMAYAGYVEQGTSRARAYPFMLPAITTNQENFKARLRAALRGAARG